MTAPTAPDNSAPAPESDIDDDQLVSPPAPQAPAGKAASKAKRPQVAPLKLGPVILAGALLLAILVAVTYRLLGPVWGSVALAGLALLVGVAVWLWRRANRRGSGRKGGGDSRGGPLARLRALLPGGGRRSGAGGGTGAGGGKKGGPLGALRRALGGGKGGGGKEGGRGGGKGGGPLGALRRAFGRGPGRSSGATPGGGGRAGRTSKPNGKSSGGRGSSGGGRGSWWPFGGNSSKDRSKNKKGKNKGKGTTTEFGPCGGPGPNEGKNKDKKEKPDSSEKSGDAGDKNTPEITGPAGGEMGGGAPAQPPSIPALRRAGGFMGTRLDDAGLLRFGESLKQDPEKIAGLRDWYRAKAEAADENPINEGVTDSLHAIANLMNRAAEIAGGLHDMYTSGNEADIHRNENPRRGEEKADHSYNKRDQ